MLFRLTRLAIVPAFGHHWKANVHRAIAMRPCDAAGRLEQLAHGLRCERPTWRRLRSELGQSGHPFGTIAPLTSWHLNATSAPEATYAWAIGPSARAQIRLRVPQIGCK